jgi:uncharacterized membrane protein YcaP (DUF421 family)
MWHDLLQPGVPYLDKIVRTVAVYGFLLLGLRVAGKRELGQLNPFDLVVLLLLANTVQNAIIGNDNSVTGGLVGAATLLLVNHGVVRYLYAHERLDRLVEGEPDVLVETGRVRPERLRRELVTRNELEAYAHRQGFASLDEIDRAILDPGGTMSFLPKQPTPDAARHQELLGRLDAMAAQIAALQGLRG